MFVPHYEIIAASEPPKKWCVVCHGIYGRGANWRSVCREVTKHRQDIGFVLVDLRMHGKSLGAPPPHTVETCAQDINQLVALLPHSAEPLLFMGHSFGGKVVLRASQQQTASQVWLIDSNPGTRQFSSDTTNSVLGVLRLLQTVPRQYESRQQFVDLGETHGLSQTLMLSLAMNLQRQSDGTYHQALDPEAMEALLKDYAMLDAWKNIDSRVHNVVCGLSDMWTTEETAQSETAGATVYRLATANHWPHVSAKRELIDVLVENLL